jgi:hypothetical protein
MTCGSRLKLVQYFQGLARQRIGRFARYRHAGAVTWIYNEFSCLARVRIRKAKVPGSKGWEMVAVKGKKEVKKDGGEEGEDGKERV